MHCDGGLALRPPAPTPTQTLQSPQGTRRCEWLFFLAVEYSARGCQNKGSDKKEGHGPAPHGVTVTTNGRKAMSEVLTVHQENWYSCREREEIKLRKEFSMPIKHWESVNIRESRTKRLPKTAAMWDEQRFEVGLAALEVEIHPR